MFSTYSSSSSSDGKRAHPAFHVQHPRYQLRGYDASNPPQSNGETTPFEGCRMHRTTATYAVAWSPSGRTPDGGDWGGRSARGNHRRLPTRDCISIAIIANTIHATIALWPFSTADHLLLDWYAVPDIAPLRPARASAAQRAAVPFLTTNTLESLPVMGHAADSRYHLGQRAAVVGPSIGSGRFNTIYAIRSATYRVHSIPTQRNRGTFAEVHST